MVFIELTQKENLIIADCHKGTEDGEYFQLVIDSISKECIKAPEKKGIDVTSAYSCIYNLLEEGRPLPKKTVSAWG